MVEQKKILVITHPVSNSGIIPISNLIEILLKLSVSIILISGNKGFDFFRNDKRYTTYGINSYEIQKNQVKRICQYIKLQIKYSYISIKNYNNFNTLLMFFGGGTLLLPILISKILQKKVIIILPGELLDRTNCIDPLTFIITTIASLNFFIADRIIIYSTNLIQKLNLEPYSNKIIIAHRHFLDIKNFNLTTPHSERPNLIGYIGRLSPEKGIKCFIQALPIILTKNHDLHVFIGGDGEMKEFIEKSLENENIIHDVTLSGWISHDDLPKYLNQLRLLVLPSYTEGLPNIMLEAMACGTPVLATPVGAIPDVIQDDETGFIMENNSPECIARNVMRALNDPDLEGVAERGRRFVEGEFTFEKVVERWKGILKDIE